LLEHTLTSEEAERSVAKLTNGHTQLEGANAVRFYAALVIVLFHLALLTKIVLPAHLDFIPRFAGFGVPLFYVMSAFSLSYGYHDQLESAAQVRKFYIRRFFRIVPLFYFMILLYTIFLWVVYNRPVSALDIITSSTFIFNLIPGYSTGFV